MNIEDKKTTLHRFPQTSEIISLKCSFLNLLKNCFNAIFCHLFVVVVVHPFNDCHHHFCLQWRNMMYTMCTTNIVQIISFNVQLYTLCKFDVECVTCFVSQRTRLRFVYIINCNCQNTSKSISLSVYSVVYRLYIYLVDSINLILNGYTEYIQ